MFPILTQRDKYIIDKIVRFPKEKVNEKALIYQRKYNEMMDKILCSLLG